jgi:S-DNA-T family DNA segregation ATPase FtsK/SpoIIIE
MAKKKRNRKRKKYFSFLSDERFKLTLGIFLVLFSLYLYLAFTSYFFTWKTDQSFEWSRVFSGPEVMVDNSGPGGGHGYFLSEWFSSILGKVGTIFLLSILVLAFALFSFDSTLEKILSLIKKGETSAGEDTWVTDQDEITPNEGEDEGEMDDEADVSKTDESLQFKTRGTEFGDSGIGEDETGTDETGTDETGKIQDDNEIEMTVEKKQNGEMVDSNTTLELEDFDPTLDLSNYRLPSIELLEEYKSGDTTVSEEELISNKNRIVETLGNYKIQIDKIKATIGPTVTLYEIVPAPGVRISKIKNLEDDIALSLSALGIRIIAPIPGRGTIGIEVPNRRPEIVSMRSIIASKKFQESKFELAIGLGKTISNETYVVELTKMPHLLIAGATGQGKSVGLNAIIASLLYKKHPAQLKFVMIDPKKVELTLYNHIEKHYLAKLPDSEEPIINDTQEVIRTLNSLTIEMDNRYNLLKSAKVRIIKEYNEKFIARKLNPREGHRYLPYIVVIVDEFADLIMTAGREIEMPLARLAQLARAVGLHLIIATQRPSTNIITGSIKANFPVRLAFKVTSMMDSRTILDSPGANQLVGRGDMLITVGSDMVRLQCAFIDTPEIERITNHISAQQSYPEAHLLPEYIDESKADLNGFNSDDKDDLFEKAARLVVEFQQGSTSLIQRKFSIGYNRAGRIIDQLESVGIVGPYEGSKARQVLIKDLLSLERFLDNDPEDPLSI